MEETKVQSPYGAYEEDIEESGALEPYDSPSIEPEEGEKKEEKSTKKEERKGKGVDRAETFMRYGKKALTLGGPVKLVRKELYIPRVSKGVKVSEKVTRKSLEGLKSLREASMPTSSMRQLTSPGYSQKGSKAKTPSFDLSRMRTLTSPQLTKLQEILVPPGLTASEKAAYKEIKMNHDIDTEEHVVEELMKLGISKRSASSAIKNLIKKRTVKKDTSLKGDPVLVAIR